MADTWSSLFRCLLRSCISAISRATTIDAEEATGPGADDEAVDAVGVRARVGLRSFRFSGESELARFSTENDLCDLGAPPPGGRLSLLVPLVGAERECRT